MLETHWCFQEDVHISPTQWQTCQCQHRGTSITFVVIVSNGHAFKHEDSFFLHTVLPWRLLTSSCELKCIQRFEKLLTPTWHCIFSNWLWCIFAFKTTRQMLGDSSGSLFSWIQIFCCDILLFLIRWHVCLCTSALCQKNHVIVWQKQIMIQFWPSHPCVGASLSSWFVEQETSKKKH